MQRRDRSVRLAWVLLFALMGTCRMAMPAAAPVWVIQSIALEVPHKGENQDTWDGALGTIFGGGLRAIYPDIQICVESPRVPPRCFPPCENAAPPSDGAGYLCEVSTGPYGILLESTLYVLAEDIDDIGDNERIAWFKVEAPQNCEPCALELPGGTLRISFKFASTQGYSGPYRGTLGTIVQELPVATPESGAPAPQPGNLQQILEQLLPGLRDTRNCTGPDRGVFADLPAGTMMFRGRLEQMLGSSEDTDRIFQASLLAGAFQDPGARQQVLQFLRSKGIDTDSPLWALAQGDLKYSQQLDDLAHRAVQYVADMALQWAGAKALGNVLPVMSRNELVREIELKMAAKLGSAQGKDLMNQLFTHSGLSAECALNELAKTGLGDVIEIPPR